MASRKKAATSCPFARDARIVVESVGDETVAYELDTKVAHGQILTLLDGDHTVARSFEAGATPTAALVTPASTIGAPTAPGAVSIEALVWTTIEAGGRPAAAAASRHPARVPWPRAHA